MVWGCACETPRPKRDVYSCFPASSPPSPRRINASKTSMTGGFHPEGSCFSSTSTASIDCSVSAQRRLPTTSSRSRLCASWHIRLIGAHLPCHWPLASRDRFTSSASSLK